ncbi:hypothetical protein ABT390_23820 [Streptomyces aurantiacus]|uniref:Uncharacterized protein n=1 Tax=Streptomyces aurantiacus JA 4570 TaxID=1286094 RepID=S3ZTK6_9ACTN|nr:hypothetical protein [Streptomyces aurantiacus]EPH46518.1 hypothetical protein STRAU_0490 [Streptomyces aurantiacus JA 4570]
MNQSTSRSRRTATLLLAGASLAVGLVASPANAAASWESIPAPEDYATVSLLPFDSQNAYARTMSTCIELCGPVAPKLWQRSGSTWKQLKPPTDVAFDTLAGTGPNDLWAIGRKHVGDGIWHVHRYDGTKWSSDMAPDTKRLEILDAEAVNRTSLWGVGNTRTTNTLWNPTVTHWDGQKWNTKTFTDIDGNFESVDVRSENDIWAVGYRSVSDEVANYQPLAMHYDGTKWSEVRLPDTPGDRNILDNVVSNGPKDVWVHSLEHVWHWDGTTWTRRDIPAGYVKSIAVHGGQTYVGVQVNKSGDPKLLRWNGTSWVADTSLTNGTHVLQLTTSPDGSMYAYSTDAWSTNYLSRLAPPAAR